VRDVSAKNFDQLSRTQRHRVFTENRDHFAVERKITPNTQSGSYEMNGEVYKDFADRDGYDPSFLGVDLPMPQLKDGFKDQAAPLLADPTKSELKYTHFSTIQSKERRQPLLTAVNIDGDSFQEMERKGSWVLDGRIAREYQLGNEAYKNNDIDKGHQVRRKDPMWGPDAEKAGGDTFAYTNSGLQHSDLNQRSWLDLENNVLNGAVALKERKTVFTGPVFSEDDPSFDNQGKMQTPTKMPMAFWKVQVWNKPGEGLQAEAFLLSQKDLVGQKASGGHVPLTPTQISSHRVTINQLEKLTHLDFGRLAEGQDRVASDAKAAQDAGIGAGHPEG
jgi:endonuclease G, mitochondrial